MITVLEKYLILISYLHLQRDVQIFLKIEIVNGYLNIIKLESITWIMVYRLSMTFIPILSTVLMDIFLIVPGSFIMYICYSISATVSTLITGIRKLWTKRSREKSQYLRLSIISCIYYYIPRSRRFRIKCNLIVPEIYHPLGWIYIQPKSIRLLSRSKG